LDPFLTQGYVDTYGPTRTMIQATRRSGDPTVTDMRATSRLLAIVLGLTAISAPARADDPESLIRQGNDLRRAGQNEQALPLFQRAYQSTATPRTAGQLGLAELATGRYVEADSHLVEALRGHSDPWVSKYRVTLEQALATIRSQVAHLEVIGAPHAAEVTVNGRMVGRLPRTPTVAVNPGRVDVRVSFSGYEPLREVRELAPGSHEEVEIRLRSIVPILVAKQTNPPPPPPTAGWLRPAGVTIGSVGLLTAGTGVALRLIANGKHDRIEEDARAGRPYDPTNGNWQSYGRAANVCLVAGGAALIGGGILWMIGRPPTTSVAVTPTTGGMQLSLWGTY
jgi:hypothetical protein